MKMNKLIKGLTLALLFAGVALPAFAVEEYVSEIYREIDIAFLQKSDDSLNVVLQKTQGDKYYYLIENYATKKVRRLIITKEYEFAMNAILVIIDNDLDNIEAVEMYATISDAFEIQQAYKEQEAQKAKKEQERVAALMEDKRETANKEYQAVQTSDDKSVFVVKKDAKLSYSNWDFHLGVLPAFGTSTTQAGTANGSLSNLFQTGLMMNFDYSYSLRPVTWGFDLFADLKFLNVPVSGDETGKNSMFSDLEFMPKVAVNSLSKKMFFRVGFAGDMNIKPIGAAAGAYLETFMTPAVGIQFRKLALGKTEFSFAYDYYLGHIWTPGLMTAMGVDAKFSILFADLDKLKLTFNLGIKDKIYVKDSGVENRASIILALGAENVVK